MPTSRKRLDYYYTIDPITNCWHWKGATRGGYGMTTNPNYTRGIRCKKMIQAHRYVYEQLKGPIPSGLILHHKCKCKNCVNPDHLEPTTNQENIRCGDLPIINKDIAEKIRIDCKSMRHMDVAEKYGISQSTVSQIVRGVTWV